jgi:hypothetical protein
MDEVSFNQNTTSNIINPLLIMNDYDINEHLKVSNEIMPTDEQIAETK